MRVTTSLMQRRGCPGVHTEAQLRELRAAVLSWFAGNGRDFPWRQTSDPFHILLAECLLRRTQATRLVEAYLELTRKYPTAYALAKANAGYLRSWFKPLGLMKRADRLIQTARILVETYEGKVPNDLDALIALPGLGIYSARAILCLGFGESYPMVDEASGRVIRRVLDIDSKGPAYSDLKLLQVAESILPRTACREFNLGLIDIAAIYCHPTNPEYDACPLASMCSYWGCSRRHSQTNMP